MSDAAFVPIIAPVKESLRGLKRTCDAVCDAGGRFVLVVNPIHGDYSDDPETLCKYAAELAGQDRAIVGIALKPDMSVNAVLKLCEAHQGQRIALIHAGFSDARVLAKRLGGRVGTYTHVFLERDCGKLYRRHFESEERVLVRDGFEQRTNRDHPPIESFSDLHVTFPEENVEGFGDFLVVGDNYSDGGGPAYTIAIHVTFIDRTKDDEMYVHHFKSNPSKSPKDPAGKFAEALDKLVSEVNRSESQILRTTAIDQFLDLHERGHFPGLGIVKKLCMNHHVETLAAFLQDA